MFYVHAPNILKKVVGKRVEGRKIMVKNKCIYKGYTFSKEMYYLCRREREENVGTYIYKYIKTDWLIKDLLGVGEQLYFQVQWIDKPPKP